MQRRDTVLAAAFLAVSLVQVLWVEPVGAPALGVVYATVFVTPLAWRRARPRAAVLVASSVWWVPLESYLFLGYVTAIILCFSLGRWSPDWRTSAPVCAWAWASGTLGAVQGSEDPTVSLLSTWLVVLAPYSLGRLMAVQEQEAEERLRLERDAARRQAVEDERARIVRELHDVVGHEVTLMSIQSEAAAQALAVAPERAAEPISAVRETAHRANRELRAILSLLGEEESAVAPDRHGLAELADRAERLGIPNRLAVVGDPWEDAPQHWLAVNRIVQECLTNAGKHAPGEKVDVLVTWSVAGVEVRAMNTAAAPPAHGAGLGLPGMAERARLLGGTLRTSYDGVLTVTAWLPAVEDGWS